MIFKLEPLNVESAEWEHSTWRGEVIVRAATEEAARRCAATAFSYVRDDEADDAASPWLQAAWSSCVPSDDPSYEAEGPTMVIAPAFFD
ncbi:MAG: hypothetical protein CMJ18_10620 [Phycisphaeraceae bacterium]|nr:hypothetical protein [Phycisphaeraceae bacterium]